VFFIEKLAAAELCYSVVKRVECWCVCRWWSPAGITEVIAATRVHLTVLTNLASASWSTLRWTSDRTASSSKMENATRLVRPRVFSTANSNAPETSVLPYYFLLFLLEITRHIRPCPPPRAGSRVVRIDPLRLLAICRVRRLNQALSVLSLSLGLLSVSDVLLTMAAFLRCVICVFCRLVVLARLSVSVWVIDWKDSSSKWPIMCWWGH